MAPPSVSDLLGRLRQQRGFDRHEVLESKIARLNLWFQREHLDSAVVGLSGGIDSAVVLALLLRASRVVGSPLKRVVAVSLPIEALGSTDQVVAANSAARIALELQAEIWHTPLGAAQDELIRQLTDSSGIAFDGWAAGQLASVLRTPALYGAVALLRSIGHRAVVVGTTNRDEGAYLGFFGKASDATVDLQPISDLHKSEVRALAQELGVPQFVLDAEPSGNVWDGRTDQQMIGTSYDLIELVLRLRELNREPIEVARLLCDGDLLVSADQAVEALHAVNAHKYAVGSPAIHLDVLPRGIPHGWPDEQVTGRWEHTPPDVPGAWNSTALTLPDLADGTDVTDGMGSLLPDWQLSTPPTPRPEPFGSVPGFVSFAHNILTETDVSTLLTALETAPAAAVDVTGRATSYGVGSYRATTFNPTLASQLWHRLRPIVPTVRFLGTFDPTDAFGNEHRETHRSWRVVGLSPLLRFMRYPAGGRHLCHYDAGFDYGDGRRTLLSVVFYLTDGTDPATGLTRFVDDNQAAIPVHLRNHDDWQRDTEDYEVLAEVAPHGGAALVFDHRLCHDVSAWSGPHDRVIIRADVVYEAVPDGRPADTQLSNPQYAQLR